MAGPKAKNGGETSSPADQQIVRVAQARALITAVLTQEPTRPHFARDIYAAREDEFKRLGYKNTQGLASIFTHMIDNEQLKAHHLGGKAMNSYMLDDREVLAQEAEKRPYNKKTKGVVMSSAPAVKIDFVRSTGRVRLTIGGYTVDLGEVAE